VNRLSTPECGDRKARPSLSSHSTVALPRWMAVAIKSGILSRREKEVAEAYASGLNHKQVGASLYIAPTTVRTHLGAIYRKLDVSSKIELLHKLDAERPRLPSTLERSAELAARPSIAVLPFENRSRSDEQEFLIDGLVDGVISALSRFRALFVISQNSSASYRSSPKTVRAIAAELGVRYVIVGSLSHWRQEVRTTAALIEAETGEQIWAGHFDRPRTELFRLQDELAGAIVSTLAPEVEAHEIARVQRIGSQNLSAWELCCKGLHAFLVPTEHSIARARSYFEQSIAADPEFSTPHAHLSRSYFYELMSGQSENWGETLRLGLAHARHALNIDHRDDVAYLVLGYNLVVQRRYEEAFAVLDRGIGLNPNNSGLYNARALAALFAPQDAYANVIRDERMALRLSPNDPLRWTFHATIGWAILADSELGTSEDALQAFRNATTMASADWHAHIGAAAACQSIADQDGARRAIDDARARRAHLTATAVTETLTPLLVKSSRLNRWVGEVCARLPE